LKKSKKSPNLRPNWNKIPYWPTQSPAGFSSFHYSIFPKNNQMGEENNSHRLIFPVFLIAPKETHTKYTHIFRPFHSVEI
jgi:hypothetical protein